MFNINKLSNCEHVEVNIATQHTFSSCFPPYICCVCLVCYQVPVSIYLCVCPLCLTRSFFIYVEDKRYLDSIVEL